MCIVQEVVGSSKSPKSDIYFVGNFSNRSSESSKVFSISDGVGIEGDVVGAVSSFDDGGQKGVLSFLSHENFVVVFVVDVLNVDVVV